MNVYFFFSSRRRHTRWTGDWSSDVCSSDLDQAAELDGRAIDRLEHLVRGSVGVLVDRLPFVTLLLRVRGNTKVERAALARRREFDRLVTELVKQEIGRASCRERVWVVVGGG